MLVITVPMQVSLLAVRNGHLLHGEAPCLALEQKHILRYRQCIAEEELAAFTQLTVVTTNSLEIILSLSQ
jgi:hypothetical protein